MKRLIPRLGNFYTLYPEIELRIEASSGLADIARYEADLALRFIHGGPKDQTAPLMSDAQIYPFAAPDLVPTQRPAEDLL